MDGSELARVFFTSAVLVAAAMCSAFISAVHLTAGHNALRGSGHQANGVAERLKLARPMMRRSAGFDTNQARRQLLEECQNVATLDLTTEDDIALRIDAVNLKNRFRNVETDRRDGFHDLAPPNRGSLNSTHINGTHVPVEEPSTASMGDIAIICRKFALSGLTASSYTEGATDE